MRCSLTVVALSLVAGAAQAHEGDVGLAISGGRIVTGIVEEIAPGVEVVTPGQRAFAGELADVGGLIYSEDPGLFTTSGTFTANSSLAFTIHGQLRSWNGSDFGTVSAERLLIEFGPDARLTPTTDSLVSGFAFNVGPTGGFDEHYNFTLQDGVGGNNPSSGVYLLALSLSSSDAAIATSEPFYLVLNFGQDELVHDAAVEYVENVIVPAPGAAVALLGLGLLASRRRR